MLNINPPDHPPHAYLYPYADHVSSMISSPTLTSLQILPIENLQMLWFFDISSSGLYNLSLFPWTSPRAPFPKQVLASSLNALSLRRRLCVVSQYLNSRLSTASAPTLRLGIYCKIHCKSASNGMHNSVYLIWLILSTRLSLKKFWSIPKSLKNSNDVACYSMESLTNQSRSVILN